MLETFAHYSLFFSNYPCLFTILLLGLLSDKRQLFYWGGLFTLLNICINYALKITFKVPLPVELHPGYAFPSGHMQMLTVFYGWLAMHHLMRMRVLFIPICLLETYGLWYFHYHTIIEITAGFLTGLFLLSVFQKIYQKPTLNRYLLILTTLVACLIYTYYLEDFKPHVVVASLALFILSIFGIIYNLYKKF